MRLWKRGLARALAAAAMLSLVQFATTEAQAQDNYPDRTLHFICAFPAGSGADVLVRYFANKMQELTGQTVVVENKPGAQSNIAAEYTARSRPDGYTLFVHSGNSIAGNMHILTNPPIDVRTDLRTVATINKQAFMITVRHDSPYQNLADLVEDQRAKGAEGSYAVNATSGLVLAEEFKQIAGLETVRIQYGSSAESLNDMLAGIVDFGAHDPVFTLGQVREGRWRALAIGAGERIQGAPDIPTFREQGYDIDQLGWWGVMVAPGVPEPVVEKINALFNEILAQEETVQFLRQQGGDAYVSTPEESQALMERTVDEWENLVEVANIPKQ